MLLSVRGFSAVGLTVAAAVGGIVFGLQASGNSAKYHDMVAGSVNAPIAGEELKRYEEAATRDARTANGMFAVAGAAALTSVVMWQFTDWGIDSISLAVALRF